MPVPAAGTGWHTSDACCPHPVAPKAQQAQRWSTAKRAARPVQPCSPEVGWVARCSAVPGAASFTPSHACGTRFARRQGLGWACKAACGEGKEGKAGPSAGGHHRHELAIAAHLLDSGARVGPARTAVCRPRPTPQSNSRSFRHTGPRAPRPPCGRSSGPAPRPCRWSCRCQWWCRWCPGLRNGMQPCTD